MSIALEAEPPNGTFVLPVLFRVREHFAVLLEEVWRGAETVIQDDLPTDAQLACDASTLAAAMSWDREETIGVWNGRHMGFTFIQGIYVTCGEARVEQLAGALDRAAGRILEILEKDMGEGQRREKGRLVHEFVGWGGAGRSEHTHSLVRRIKVEGSGNGGPSSDGPGGGSEPGGDVE